MSLQDFLEKKKKAKTKNQASQSWQSCLKSPSHNGNKLSGNPSIYPFVAPWDFTEDQRLTVLGSLVSETLSHLKQASIQKKTKMVMCMYPPSQTGNGNGDLPSAGKSLVRELRHLESFCGSILIFFKRWNMAHSISLPLHITVPFLCALWEFLRWWQDERTAGEETGPETSQSLQCTWQYS